MGRVSEGIMVVAGGFLIHLVLGTLYMWGNTNVYVRSYFCYNGDYGVNMEEYSEITGCKSCTLSQGTVQIIFPFMFQALSLTMPFGVPLAKKLNSRVWGIICAILLPGAILGSSFTTNFTVFTALYGIFFGMMCGFIYMVPFNLGHQYFPNNKGTVSGIISGGFGLGSLIFSEVVYNIVNPDNKDAVTGGCYPPEVANQLPLAIQWLSGLYCACMILGSLLQFTPSNMIKQELQQIEQINQEQNQQKDGQEQVECPTLGYALKQPKLYLATIQALFLAAIGVLISSNYKPYGLLIKNLYNNNFSDKYLTWVGNAGSIMNSLSRIVWGLLYDKLQIRYIFLILAFFQIIIISTLTFVSDYRGLYITWVILAYAMYGGLYAIFPTLSAKLFGKKFGLVVIAVIFQGFTGASWAQFFIVKYGVHQSHTDEQQHGEYNLIFHLYVIAPIVAGILALLVQYKIDWASIVPESLLPFKSNQGQSEKKQKEEEEEDDDDDYNFQNRQSLENRALERSIQKRESLDRSTTNLKRDKVLSDSSYISNQDGKIGNNYPGYKR